MYKVYSHSSLKKFNTFGINVNAKYLTLCKNVEEISCVFKDYPDTEIFILGGGSNILFTGDVNSLVMVPDIKETKIIKEGAKYVDIEVGAGVNWDNFVQYCIENDFGGLENLSWIPGNVGASPIQNIGAYGKEVKEHVLQVKGIYRKNQEPSQFSNSECHFQYRNSIFKNELKGKFVITSVIFRLTRKHEYVLDYDTVKEKVQEIGGIHLKNIREAIIQIRKSKLPDPEEYGNAGSFFKNPVIEHSVFVKLRNQYPDIKGYDTEEGIKVPAAWLIEKAGFKGVKKGNCGTYPKQPLVIINYGMANGKEIFQFANHIRQAIDQQFQIKLEYEVNIQ